MRILMMDKVKSEINEASTIHRYELIKNLSECGNNLFVLANSDLKLNRVHTTILGNNIEKNQINKLLFKFIYLKGLFSIGFKQNIDILYTRNELIGLIGLFIKFFNGSKVVIEVNGIQSDESKTVRENLKENKIKKINLFRAGTIELFVMKNADILIAVTEGIKNFLVNKGISEKKIFTIENGANIESFRPIEDSQSLKNLRKEYNINDNEYVVLFVGSFAPWQGVEYIIEAAPLILKIIPNTKFLIVGDGIMRNKWEEMVTTLNLKNYFIFTGKIPYKKIPLFINLSDICTVTKKPLESGYSPLKLYEYLACGKPVIASNLPGFEIIEQYNAGILVDPTDTKDLSGAIINLLENEQLRKEMGLNGRKLALDKYSWKETALKLTNIFEKSGKL